MDNYSIYSDPVVACPYDKFHRIALSKIQTHIVKCEKNYPPGYKETCPFNATHRLFKDELTEHIQKCPQRRVLQSEMDQYTKNHGSLMTDFIEQSCAESNLDHGESWDGESLMNCVPSIDGRSIVAGSIEEPINSQLRGIQATHKRRINLEQDLRRPRGYSEAMLVGGDSERGEGSDMESVISVMGVGRGRSTPSQKGMYQRFGFGRGRPM